MLTKREVAWVIKWAATGAQAAGVFMMASRLASPAASFVVMLVGSVGWSVGAWMVRDWAAVALNCAFTASNLLGLRQWT